MSRCRRSTPRFAFRLREEIKALQRELGITTIYVTHDQEEALSMSDRIMVMSEGRVEQIGTPFEIYNNPRTRFVASFVGTLNILRCKVVDPDRGRISLDGQEMTASRGIVDAKAGDIRSVALRPEAVLLNGAGGERNRLAGTIEEVNFLGSVVRVRVRFQENAISLDTFNNPNAPPPKHGDPVTVSFAPRRPAARGAAKALELRRSSDCEPTTQLPRGDIARAGADRAADHRAAKHRAARRRGHDCAAGRAEAAAGRHIILRARAGARGQQAQAEDDG